MAIRKNVKRIDPRYFLEETTNRGGIDEARMSPEQQAQIDKMRDARGMTGEEFGEKHGNAGDVHSQKNSYIKGTPVPRYGPHLPVFESEVDQALYILANTKLKSDEEKKFVGWVSSLGYTQDGWNREGKNLKAILKQKISELPDFPPEGFLGSGQKGVQSAWQLMRKSEIPIPPTAGAPAASAGGGGMPEDWEPPPPGIPDDPRPDDPWAGMPGFGGVSENKKRKRRTKRMRQSKLKETIKEVIQKKLS